MSRRHEMHKAYLEFEKEGDEKRANALAFSLMIDDLAYIPSEDDKGIIDLSYCATAVARHLARCGWRWEPTKAMIKKRMLNEPGTYEDACFWVSADEPDDPLEDLQHMSIAEIDALPDELRTKAKRKLGMLPPVEPQQGGWMGTPNNIAITDVPDTPGGPEWR